ncbi:hypothetical protein [Brachyspira murdochii]|uniref:hypothetical protein n=1 Tax=Brachyspira murdochii TaxID=84378 RepID=UPI0012F4FC99|nr:hypothetical protein [Brachyspira murdochii]
MKIEAEQVLSLIKTTSNLPAVKVDRKYYLLKEFSRDYSHIMNDIINKGPYDAGVPVEVIESKAKAAINFETNKATAVSFAAGIPGGFAMIGTIPADLTQFMGHTLRIAQKLGMIGFSDADDMTDDEANMVLIYLGVMFGESQAVIALKTVAQHLAGLALKQLPKMALTKIIGWPTIKALLKLVGIKLTKDVAAKTAAKVIPILGGVALGGLTFASLKVMSNRLYDKLAESRFNNI